MAGEPVWLSCHPVRYNSLYNAIGRMGAMRQQSQHRQLSTGYDSTHVLLVLLALILFLPFSSYHNSLLLRGLVEFGCLLLVVGIGSLPLLRRDSQSAGGRTKVRILLLAAGILALAEVLPTGAGWGVAGRLLRSITFVLCVSAVVETPLREEIRRIRDRFQRSEAALRRERDFFANVIASAGGLLVVFDARGDIVRFNSACEALTGRSEEEVRGQPVWDILYPADEVDSIRKMLADLTAGIFPSYHESALDASDGTRRWISWSSTVLQGVDGEITHVIGTGMDITAQKSSNEELQRLTLLDPLTGLYNRRGFLLFATQQLQLAARMHRHALLFFCDVDRMKEINDRFGHRVGDEALQTAATALTATFRGSDVIGRYGGDEFVVLAVEQADANAGALIDRLHASLESLAVGRQYPLTLSIGVARYLPDAPLPLEGVIEQADAAMYAEKHRKRGLATP